METEEPAHDTALFPTADHDPTPSSATRPRLSRSPASNPNLSSLPPLTTNVPSRVSFSQRKPTYIDRTLSSFSSHSFHSFSRPQSNAFPFFLSSLPYALVRDFAYPIYNQLHYGPPLDLPSSASTPASEYQRRLSDPLSVLKRGGSRLPWSPEEDPTNTSTFGMQLQARSFADDGPPYAEDADLLSPIVTTTRHKKTKSNLTDYSRSINSVVSDDYSSIAPEGGVMLANGQVAEPFIRYTSPDQHDQSFQHLRYATGAYTHGRESLSSRDAYSPSDQMATHYYDDDDDDEDSRLSRNYQFHIASPDEEFHGKAVALFDFARENDNELPFVEGQVLWVSYRHGEGWLVAQDPKSGESGLIPEEYVRLLRDIEGGLRGLNGGDPNAEDDADFDTPIDARKPLFHNTDYRPPADYGLDRSNSGQHYPPVVSHFTTSSKDLEPYPVSQSYVGHAQAGDNTPVPNQQSTFSGHTFFDDRPDHEPNIVSESVSSPTRPDLGGGELLSPETFKREDSLRSRERRSKENTDIINTTPASDESGNDVKIEPPLLAS